MIFEYVIRARSYYSDSIPFFRSSERVESHAKVFRPMFGFRPSRGGYVR